jgi:uncharacterized delta-60 repeat protein
MTRRPHRLGLESFEDRTTPALALDPTFGTGGKVIQGGVPFGAVAVQTDGRVLVAGTAAVPGQLYAAFAVARLNADGSLDTGFGNGGVAVVPPAGGLSGAGSETPAALVVQSDGKIVLAGTVDTAPQGAFDTDFAAVRLLPNGAVDTSFGTGGQVAIPFPLGGSNRPATLAAASLQPDGDLVLAGTMYVSGATEFALARLRPDGTPDPSFGTAGTAAFAINPGGQQYFDDRVAGMAIGAGGRIVLSGQVGSTGSDGVVRLRSDGSLDPSFGSGGLAALAGVTAGGVAVQSDGGVVVAGSIVNGGGRVQSFGDDPITFDSTDFAAVRLLADGSPDPAFGNSGMVSVPFTQGGTNVSGAGQVAVLSDGRIVLGGWVAPVSGQQVVARNRFGVAGLTAAGQTDRAFGEGGTTTVSFPGNSIFSGPLMAVVPDGKIILTGTADPGENDVLPAGQGSTVLARLLTSPQPARLVVSGRADGSAAVYAAGAGGSFQSAGGPIAPFPGFAGDVRVATGDFNGDGVPDTVLVTGPGTKTLMAVVSGKDGSILVPPTDPFGDANFTFGGFVAAGDIDHSGRADWVVTPELRGGPRVVIFKLLADGTFDLTSPGQPSLVANFFGIGDPSFRDGDRPALGDINGDGILDVFSIAAFNGGPRTAIFDGKDVLVARAANRDPHKLVGDFFAAPSGADEGRGGRSIAVGDVNGDGVADLIATGDNLLGTGNQVVIFSGADLIAGKFPGFGATPLANFAVSGQSPSALVSVAAVNADGDARADVAVGSGAGQESLVRVYLGKDLSGTTEPASTSLDPFGGPALNGVFVG